jgi:hypothetical protein
MFRWPAPHNTGDRVHLKMPLEIHSAVQDTHDIDTVLRQPEKQQM